MTLILTFLGKGGTGRTTLAIAAAKQLAAQGQKVLLAIQDTSPAPGILLNCDLTPDLQVLEPNLWVQQLKSTVLLEQSWEDLKQAESEYLRTPFFKTVYGQELGILPGMDSALALNFLREQSKSRRYDVLIYDGSASQETLRMLGMPDILSWYIRRFRQVFLDSDFAKALMPFVQPVTSAVLTVNWSDNSLSEPTNQAMNFLREGTQAVADPTRVAAYLVTTAEASAIAAARYFWGSAQQVGLTIGGILLNQGAATVLGEDFAPLPVTPIPTRSDQWQPLQAALPNFKQASQAPRSIAIDVSGRLIKLFLPGFDKKQVKLTQYGPELTIEAGDQRRNVFLPPELEGKPVTGAKFHDRYLIISLG
jgi:arsenite-transporting ATPase